MRAPSGWLVSVLLAVLLGAPWPAAAAPGNATDALGPGATVDTGSAIVQLTLDPLSTAPRTRPPQGKKVDFDSASVKSYRALLSAQRNDFKQWLRANAPGAKVTGEYDVSLNAVAVRLGGVALATIAGAPMVRSAQYQGLYSPVGVAADPDLGLISAPAAWAAAGGGKADAGEGIKVAILDTGVDVTHPCFSDAGYPAQHQLGDPRFTNNKVIVAKVFNNKTPSRGFTAEAIQAHGSHVAGTVACNAETPATVDGVTIPNGVTGVAPRALLGSYNIFPADVTNARSEDILDALEAAYQDGFDVANMSLGGGASGIQDLLTVAVDDLDEAGMVVAVAAGNSGPGHFTVESPGSAARALTAGAASVGHFLASPITAGGSTVPGLPGSFAVVTADLTAPLAAVPGSGANGLDLACAPLAALTGRIALVSRGGCTFSTKIRNAQAAGAAAVIVSNNAAGDAIVMGQDGTPGQPTIPAYMVSRTDGAVLAGASGGAATIGAGEAYFISGNDDFMADFSSQGPTDVDFRVKPDVVAPGVNVLSSIPTAFCGGAPCFAFFQGTSMATPHLAGSAAVVLWSRRSSMPWSAAQVRSAIVNAADQGVLKKTTSTALEPDVLVIGAGREDLLAAVQARAALDPVSVSFGAVPSGAGQTLAFDVQVSDLTGAGGSYAVSIASTGGGPGISWSAAPATLSLAAGGTATVTVTMAAAKGAALGDHQALLTLGPGAGVAHAAVYAFVKR